MFKSTILATFLASLSCIVNADMIKLQYTAGIDNMYFAECTNLVNGSCDAWDNTDVVSSLFFDNNLISISDQVSGSFQYDTSLDYNLSDDGHQAIYTDAISNYEINLGNTPLPNTILTRSSFGDSLSIVNDRDIGRFLFDSFYASTLFSQDDWFASSNVSLQNRFGTLLDSFDIPTDFELEDFTSATFRVGFLYRPTGDQLQISGNITELSLRNVSSVSTPSIVYLLIIPLLFMIVRSHKLATSLSKTV